MRTTRSYVAALMPAREGGEPSARAAAWRAMSIGSGGIAPTHASSGGGGGRGGAPGGGTAPPRPGGGLEGDVDRLGGHCADPRIVGRRRAPADDRGNEHDPHECEVDQDGHPEERDEETGGHVSRVPRPTLGRQTRRPASRRGPSAAREVSSPAATTRCESRCQAAPAGGTVPAMTQARKPLPARGGEGDVSPLDKRIIAHLQQDGRRPFTQIASDLGVSEAAVRARTSRLIERGVLQIVGVTDPLKLGYDQMAMIGVRCEGDRLIQAAEEIGKLPEVIYVVVTAGAFDLLVEAVCEDSEDLLRFLTEKLRRVSGVQSTETFVYLRIVKQTYQWGNH